MIEVPLIDEQEFDWESEIARTERCIHKLTSMLYRGVTKGNQATVEEAIALLADYVDELEGNR